MSEGKPAKVTLQEHNAIKFGRTLAKKQSCSLYRQPILETGKPEFVKNLKPYE